MTVDTYLKKYQVDRSKPGEYDRIAKKFGLTMEAVRSRYRRLRAKGKVELENHHPTILSKMAKSKKGSIKVIEEEWIDNGDEDFEFNSPESLNELKAPIEHDPRDEKILIVNDIHIPYHVKEVVDIIFNDAKKEDVSTIVLNGDVLDAFMISRFSKRPDKAKLFQEVDMTKRFLDQIRKGFPDATLYFKEANHEVRIRNYIINSAPGLFGLAEVEIANLLKLKDFGAHFIESTQILKIGHLNVIHGHETPMFPLGLNIARSVWNKTKASTTFGHFHRTQQNLEKDIDGNVQGCWAVGCACDLNPDYMPINNWNWGHGIVTTKSDGTFSFRNKIIDSSFNIY